MFNSVVSKHHTHLVSSVDSPLSLNFLANIAIASEIVLRGRVIRGVANFLSCHRLMPDDPFHFSFLRGGATSNCLLGMEVHGRMCLSSAHCHSVLEGEMCAYVFLCIMRHVCFYALICGMCPTYVSVYVGMYAYVCV